MAKPYNETGFSRKNPRDETCDSLLHLTKPLVEVETGRTFPIYTCEEYMTKPSYGTNYKIKVKTDQDYLHLHLYTPPQGAPVVNLIESGRRLEDDLSVPFDLRGLTPSLKAGSFYNYS